MEVSFLEQAEELTALKNGSLRREKVGICLNHLYSLKKTVLVSRPSLENGIQGVCRELFVRIFSISKTWSELLDAIWCLECSVQCSVLSLTGWGGASVLTASAWMTQVGSCSRWVIWALPHHPGPKYLRVSSQTRRFTRWALGLGVTDLHLRAPLLAKQYVAKNAHYGKVLWRLESSNSSLL